MGGKYPESAWAEAKRRCKLSDDHIRMAKELGFSPRSLIKNIPRPDEHWKVPVAEWIRCLYREKHGLSQLQTAPGPSRDKVVVIGPPDPEPPEQEEWDDDADEADLRAGHEAPTDEETSEQNSLMLRRQAEYRTAADYVAREFAHLPEVMRVALFGSVAEPLKAEIPRFTNFRRHHVAVWHECNDVDLAVWMTDLTRLKNLQKARGRALNRLLSERSIGVPHFAVDIHIMEPRTDRYRGRLCGYGECPKPQKQACFMAGCGAQPFLRQFDGYSFDRIRFVLDHAKRVLFERNLSEWQVDAITDSDVPF